MSMIKVATEIADESFIRMHYGAIKKLLEVTHFTWPEIDALAIIYSKYLNEFGMKREQMDISQFRAFLQSTFQINDDFIVDRIFWILDRNMTYVVPLETWVKSLSLFLRGTLDEKMQFCFSVYDLAGKGKIKRNDVIKLTRKYFMSARDELVEIAIKDFADILVKKLDVDGDTEVSYIDYSTSVRRQPELLECFGRCLPDILCTIEFLKTFTHVMPV